MPLGEVVDLRARNIQAAGCNLVESRLLHVRTRPLDERDVGLVFPAELVAKTCCELQATGATTDDDNAMRLKFPGARSHRHGGRRCIWSVLHGTSLSRPTVAGSAPGNGM